MSNKVSRDMATRFLKLSINLGHLFSNLSLEHDRIGCMIINKDNYSILTSGVTTCVYDESVKIDDHDKKRTLYVVHAEEDALTKANKIGISLDDTIAIVSHFPCFHCIKLLSQSGITTIITVMGECCQENIEIFRRFESKVDFMILDRL